MIEKAVDIGPVTIHLYGLIISFAVLAGWYIAKRRSALYKIDEKVFDDPILLLPLLLSIIGARIYHVLDYWNFYSKDLLSILKISSGGLGIWGALLGAFFGLLITARLKKIKFLTVLDITAPSMIFGQAIGRIANFINQEGYGHPTDLPWGIYIESQNRPLQLQSFSYFHPTFFYEAILNILIFFALLKISKKSKFRGQVFASYLILYGLSRFTIEFFRIDTWVVGQIKLAHMLSILSVIVGLALFYSFRRVDTR